MATKKPSLASKGLSDTSNYLLAVCAVVHVHTPYLYPRALVDFRVLISKK